MTARLLAERDVADLTVEDPPIEDVIELVFAQAAGMSTAEAGPEPSARTSTTTSPGRAFRSRATSSTASPPTCG